MSDGAPHTGLEQVRAEREFHRGRLLVATGWIGVAVSVVGVVIMLGMGLSWRDVVPMSSVAGFSAACVLLAGRGHRHLAFVVLAAGLLVASADAHIQHLYSPVAAAYPMLIVVAGASLFARARLIPLAGVVLVAILAIRLARLVTGLEGLDEWLSVTFDLLALTVVATVLLYVDRRRSDRDTVIMEEALLRLEAQRQHNDELRRRAEHSAAVARDASEAKSRFLARVSHELRTPLNAVLGYSELLQEEGLPSEVAKDVGRIHTSAGHLLGMVDDVLDLSRIDAGRLELLLEPVPLVDLAAEVSDVVRPMVERNGNTLDVHASSVTVDLDRARVRQVLLNLLSNAAKFTEGGTVGLDIRAGQDAVELEVWDSGIGIRPERLTHVFEPFTQAEADTPHRYGGTGLGLALSDRLVRAMGGRIEVVSELDVGSTFTVILPVARRP